MTAPAFKLLDGVSLTRDLPEDGLHVGDRGTLVEILEGPDGLGYMVEFADDNGAALALPVVVAEDLEIAIGKAPRRSQQFLLEVAGKARASLHHNEGVPRKASGYPESSPLPDDAAVMAAPH
jgi:hypothetical protein